MTLKEVLGEELFAQVEAKINEVNAGQTDKSKHGYNESMKVFL